MAEKGAQNGFMTTLARAAGSGSGSGSGCGLDNGF